MKTQMTQKLILAMSFSLILPACGKNFAALNSQNMAGSVVDPASTLGGSGTTISVNDIGQSIKDTAPSGQTGYSNQFFQNGTTSPAFKEAIEKLGGGEAGREAATNEAIRLAKDECSNPYAPYIASVTNEVKILDEDKKVVGQITCAEALNTAVEVQAKRKGINLDCYTTAVTSGPFAVISNQCRNLDAPASAGNEACYSGDILNRFGQRALEIMAVEIKNGYAGICF